MKRSVKVLLCVLCFALLCGCGTKKDGPAAETPAPGTAGEPTATPAPTPAPTAEPAPTPAPTPEPTPSPAPMSLLYQGAEVNSVTVLTGAEFTLSADTGGAGGEVVFSSDNEAVAVCDREGRVHAVAEGTANITASLGGQSSVCKVTVTRPANPTVAICFLGKPIYDFTMNATANETIQLKADVQPSGAGGVVWSTTDEKIATVSSDGLVTALSEGSCQVVCTCGESSTKCWVRVKGQRPAYTAADQASAGTEPALMITFAGYLNTDFTIGEGQSIDMNYKLYNTDTTESVSWSVKDPAIATVDMNGMVTGVKEGNTELYATCGALKATCIVRVTK